MVKNLPGMWEAWVRSLGWEDPMEEGRQPTLVSLPEESLWTEEPGRLQSMGSDTTEPLTLFSLKRRVTLQISGIKGYLKMFRE